MTRPELIALVTRIVAADGTEEEIAALLTELRRNVPDPHVTDLIYYSDEDLTAEEIVDRALAYRPITL